MSDAHIIVVGAGHAGCEAALACARLGAQVTLVTLRLDGIAQMSCNPAIGGVGKGHLVREIDALGGAMGEVADATAIQCRRLNASRGPAVQATRVQSDAQLYKEAMAARLRREANITLLAAEVVNLRQDGRGICGVVLKSGQILDTRAVIITTGTFLNGLCHVGEEQFAGGRMGDAPANALSHALAGLGVQLGRFKTGTTPRLAADSIDFSKLEAQPGDVPAPRFAFEPTYSPLPQVDCHITYTQPSTHALIRANLHRSPLYQGIIRGLGPRYCPSLEDKVVRFADKDRHQIFLEPEGLNSARIYPSGLSTSLPKDVQLAFLRSIEGLDKVRVVQWGYAVEYDYAPPTQLFPSLMSKAVPGLFLAGQINGTSGYEEAAAQGLMAGLNAVRHLRGHSPAVLGRNQAYIGVLIDDLVTRGVDEPYRMFTSRAEHRLVLRESNAEARLTALATTWGLISPQRQHSSQLRQAARDRLRLGLSQVASVSWCQQRGFSPKLAGKSYEELLRRPEVQLSQLVNLDGFDQQAAAWVQEEVKYAGYIARELREVDRLRELEQVTLPADAIYHGASGLSREIQEKLSTIRPATLGQASRIPGMTPAALALLRIRRRAQGRKAI